MAENAATVVEKFWKHVQKTGGCWLWTGYTDQNGYGKIYQPLGHRSGLSAIGAHRVSWEIHFGPVPEGMEVLHNCPGGDNPGCVNPAHLWLGTQTENNADRNAKGRQAKGERHGMAKLDAVAVSEIRARHAAGGLSQGALAKDYGVSVATISAILTRRYWKHVA